MCPTHYWGCYAAAQRFLGFEIPATSNFLYVRKNRILRSTTTTIDIVNVKSAKEKSPLTGSNHGPQDCEFSHWQLQSCALPAELRRVYERRSSFDDYTQDLPIIFLWFMAQGLRIDRYGDVFWETSEVFQGLTCIQIVQRSMCLMHIDATEEPPYQMSINRPPPSNNLYGSNGICLVSTHI